MKQAEFRGCDSFVCAKITKDDKTGYTTGTVTEIAPIASIAKTSDVSNETHFYDNTGMIQIKAVGVDTVTFVVPDTCFSSVSGYRNKYSPALNVIPSVTASYVFPPSLISTMILVDPASIEFSTSSFTIERGLSTTSPAEQNSGFLRNLKF